MNGTDVAAFAFAVALIVGVIVYFAINYAEAKQSRRTAQQMARKSLGRKSTAGR